MPRIRISVLLVLFSLLGVLFATSLAAQQSQRRGPTRGRRQQISGVVRDDASHEALNDVQLDLRADTGGVAVTVFTSGAGNFVFDGVADGTYHIETRIPGYVSSSQGVQVSGAPIIGLEVELHRSTSGAPTGGPAVVSVQELSIPHKAQDAMQKGMQLLYEKNDFQGSVAQFQRAIEAYPKYYEAYTQMGVAYMKMGDAASSEQALRKSIEMNDRYIDGFNFLAMLFSNNRRFADSEPIARKAVSLDANSFQANFELGRSLYGLNRPEDAEESASTAAKLKPDNPQVYLVLANIHVKLKKYPTVVDDLDHYLKLEPNGPEAEQARETRDKIQQALSEKPSTRTPPEVPR
jgi:tetratricopeptide (TPR) repeat protein